MPAATTVEIPQGFVNKSVNGDMIEDMEDDNSIDIESLADEKDLLNMMGSSASRMFHESYYEDFEPDDNWSPSDGGNISLGNIAKGRKDGSLHVKLNFSKPDGGCGNIKIRKLKDTPQYAAGSLIGRRRKGKDKNHESSSSLNTSFRGKDSESSLKLAVVSVASLFADRMKSRRRGRDCVGSAILEMSAPTLGFEPNNCRIGGEAAGDMDSSAPTVGDRRARVGRCRRTSAAVTVMEAPSTPRTSEARRWLGSNGRIMASPGAKSRSQRPTSVDAGNRGRRRNARQTGRVKNPNDGGRSLQKQRSGRNLQRQRSSRSLSEKRNKRTSLSQVRNRSKARERCVSKVESESPAKLREDNKGREIKRIQARMEKFNSSDPALFKQDRTNRGRTNKEKGGRHSLVSVDKMRLKAPVRQSKSSVHELVSQKRERNKNENKQKCRRAMSTVEDSTSASRRPSKKGGKRMESCIEERQVGFSPDASKRKSNRDRNRLRLERGDSIGRRLGASDHSKKKQCSMKQSAVTAGH